MTWITDGLNGAGCFFTGLSLAMSPKLRRFIVMPFVLGLIIATSASYWLVATVEGWLAVDADSVWRWIVTPLLWLVALIGSGWLAALLAALISAPLLSHLALKVDALTNSDAEMPNEDSLSIEVVQSIGREFSKWQYHLPRLLGLLLLTVVPIINLVAPFLWVLFGAWMTSVQFSDYRNENLKQDFVVTLHQLKQDRCMSLGFGICCFFALSIPLLNFVVVPVAVVGGTLLNQQLTQQASPNPASD